MTTILSVALANHPGALAEVLEILAKSHINVQAVEAEALGDFGQVHLLVADAGRTAQVLRDEGHNVIEAEALELRLPDAPGELARVTRRLADADINIVSLFGTTPADGGQGRILVRVNKSAAARKSLGVK